jgi:hypothetical protein
MQLGVNTSAPAQLESETISADILKAMRRWIAILLMTVLPLQLSWAVAASYCQDELGAGAQHFGHHVHGDHDGVDAAKNLAKGQQHADRDCGCSGQLCGAHLLPAGLDALPVVTPGQQLSTAVPRTYQYLDPPRIERPKWPVSP